MAGNTAAPLPPTPARALLWHAITLPILLAVLYKVFSPTTSLDSPPTILEDHEIFSLVLPATYTHPTADAVQYARIPASHLNATPDASRADTTAVILNWSRLPNVRALAALLCDAALVDIIARVVIWNNSPRALRAEDFACPHGKLQIVNSPENLYFHARFLACAEAKTPYCYTQDDDYLVRPEILRALHARADPTGPIHLLPAHEHLSTTLRTTLAPAPAAIHTSFAWLGHGTLLPSARAASFLALLRALGAGANETQMADNYWSVLANAVPAVWFDQGVELGGGQPFTVGGAGEARNVRHIAKAAEYLDTILSCSGPACPAYPYVDTHPAVAPEAPAHAPCVGVPCVFETNVRLLAPDTAPTGARATDMLQLEAHRRTALGVDREQHYLAHAPSNAVDGRTDTAFRSFEDARKGEYVALDLLAPLEQVGGDVDAELVFLVPGNTFPIFMASSLQTSLDGIDWTTRHATWRCAESTIHPVDDPGMEEAPALSLQECSVRSLDADAVRARWFRVLLNDDVNVKWGVHEVWMRVPSRGDRSVSKE